MEEEEEEKEKCAITSIEAAWIATEIAEEVSPKKARKIWKEK